MRFEVITEKSLWVKALDVLVEYDFVHTYDFHRVSEVNGEGQPILFVVFDENGRLLACWPALKRSIPDSPYFDLTGVYGYGGPLFARDVRSENVMNFLFDGMKNLGAVALFSRMHPLFVDAIEDEAQRGLRLSDVVVIDVRPVADVLSLYRGSHRREIVNSQKSDVRIFIDENCEHIKDFSSIYRDSMLDLNALSYYHFTDDYFHSLIKSDDFKIIAIFAELDGKKIAGSIFIITGGIMQYYLSGTVADYRKLAPSKAIIACAHKFAIDLGLSKLVLGGGVGSAKDSLFKFKTGFSDLSKPFYIFKKILNDVVYQDLCIVKKIDSKSISFFPAYRT
jgi:hypothetical protein